MSKPLSDHLSSFLRSAKLETELHRTKLPQYWAEAVGEKLAQRAEFAGFEHGVLRIRVQEAAWRHELMLRREELRTIMNERIGSAMISEIVVR